MANQDRLTPVGAEGFGIDGVEAAARCHEKTVTAGSAEAHVAANFRQFDLADALTFWRKNMYAVVSFADPAGAGPDVAIAVAANTVRQASDFLAFDKHFHGSEFAAVLQFRAVDIPNFDVFGSIRVVRGASISNVYLFVVWGKTQTIRLENIVRHFLELARLIEAIDRFLEKQLTPLKPS